MIRVLYINTSQHAFPLHRSFKHFLSIHDAFNFFIMGFQFHSIKDTEDIHSQVHMYTCTCSSDFNTVKVNKIIKFYVFN